MKHLLLASQSPRRKQLLEQAELTFSIRTAHADEDFPNDLDAEKVPLFIAVNKAQAVFQSLTKAEQENHIIIAADTVVVLDGKIIGKPRDEADAIAILRALSGRVHKVVTGVVLQTSTGIQELKEITEVHFLPVSDEQIQHYISKYQPYDKAGAYAIQEWIGVTGIKFIEGDFYNVMGLPVSRVVQSLRNFKDYSG